MASPLFSIVTITYNAERELPVTLASVDSQTEKDYEHLIVDGASKDATVAIACAADQERRRVVSEPDKGLYDAMNKAWRMCSGDVVAVCNDRFCTPDAVTKLVRAIEQGEQDCIGSHADLVYVEGERIIRTWHDGGRAAGGRLASGPSDVIPETQCLREIRRL